MTPVATSEAPESGDARSHGWLSRQPGGRSVKRFTKTIIALVVAGGAALAWLANALRDTSEIAADVEARRGGASGPSANAPAAHPGPVEEVVRVAWYGDLTIGGDCAGTQVDEQGKKRELSRTWNCTTMNNRRVRCQNGIVVSEICVNGCTVKNGGQDDECK
jgi:hypothetical protein